MRLPLLAAPVLLGLVWGLAPTAGALSWTDASDEAGVSFLHVGGLADFYEVTGSGVCFADLDGDAYADLYFVNQRHVNRTDDEREKPLSRLYRNNADGTFTDVTAGSGAGLRAQGQGCSAADYDGDGDLDLMVTAFGENALLRNDGAFRFTNVTTAAGLSMSDRCADGFACWGTGASWIDLNLDGCLDLYVVNYVQWNQTVDKGNGPEHYEGQENYYFENGCDGTFSDKTAETNLDDDPGPNHSKTFQATWADYDRDGDPDVYITSDGEPNTLFRNNGDGTFTDVAAELAVDDPRAGMGLVFLDLDGDERPDLYMTHYDLENNGLYLNAASGPWPDHSGEGDLDDDWRFVGWGAVATDVDFDGDLDLVVVNGHTQTFDAPIERCSCYERLVFRNDGAPTFTNVTHEMGPGFGTTATTARGLALADYDLDGIPDFVVSNTFNETSNLLRGSGEASGGRLWIQLRQAGANLHAVGAEIRVTPRGKLPVTHVVQASSSYVSQSDYLHPFGLGDSATAIVRVRWPDGLVEEHLGVVANQTIRIERGISTIVTDVVPPITTLLATGTENRGWFVEPPTITLSATDRGTPTGSGVTTTEFRIGDGEWGVYAGPFGVGEGRHRIEFRSRDAAGNVEPVRSADVHVDLTPPTASLEVHAESGRDGWLLGPANLTFRVEDALSGPGRALYSDGGAPWREAPGFQATLETDGDRDVSFIGVDAAGRAGLVQTRRLKVDVAPPETALTFEGPHLFIEGIAHVTSDTRLRLDAQDGAGSGVAATEIAVNDAEWSAYDAPVRLSLPDGEHRVRHRSTDVAGRLEAERIASVFLDNHRPPPVLILSPAPDAAHAGDTRLDLAPAAPLWSVTLGPVLGVERLTLVSGIVPVAADAGPDVSGVSWTRLLIDGIERANDVDGGLRWSWDTTQEKPGIHELRVEAADGRGNVGAAEMKVVVL